MNKNNIKNNSIFNNKEIDFAAILANSVPGFDLLPDDYKIGDYIKYPARARRATESPAKSNADSYSNNNGFMNSEYSDFEEKEYAVIHESELDDYYILDEDLCIDDDEFEDEEYEEWDFPDDDDDDDEFEDEEYEELGYFSAEPAKTKPDFPFSDFPDFGKWDTGFSFPFVNPQPPTIESDEFDEFEGFDEYNEDDIFGDTEFFGDFPVLSKVIRYGIKSFAEEEEYFDSDDIIGAMGEEIKRFIRCCYND